MSSRHGLAAAAAAALLALVGCSGGGGSSSSTGRNPTSKAIGDAAIQGADVVATAGPFRQPLDAAPSPDGSVVYFAALADTGSAIFSVPAAGGPVSVVAAGAPFLRASAVAVATDGSRVYAADPRSGSTSMPGAILTAPTTGGPQVPTVLLGTGGTAPRGLDVVHRPDGDVIFFTGTDPANGSPGIFQIAAAGGLVSTVAEGSPFSSLDSVAVTAKGVAYVSDRGAVPGQGQVFRVEGGVVTPVLTGLHLGAPGGVSLVHGDTALVVSSHDSTTLADQLLFLDLASGKTAVASKGLGTAADTSGGLHRASGAAVMAWTDTNGRILRISLR